MEELPSDTKLEEAEKSYTLELLGKLEKFIDISPTLEALSAVRDSLVDIKSILAVQNQRLEKLEVETHGNSRRLDMVELRLGVVNDKVSRLEDAVSKLSKDLKETRQELKNDVQELGNRLTAVEPRR